MNNEVKSSRFRIGSKIASILLSATLFATTFTGLGSALVTTTAEAAGSYGLADSIEDGNILHCFNWKISDIKNALPEIAEAGFTSVQTSPLQPHDASGPWYWLYQPLGFTIGNELGDEQALKDLCTEADKYGIKVIVDVVANHLAGSKSGEWKSYIQSDLNDSQYFHNQGAASNWDDRNEIIFKNIGMPDLNTEHSHVIEVVSNYVKALKNAGVDGIRWDAAKHIGLPSEGSSFWSTMSGLGMYNYGEILDGPAGKEEENGQILQDRYNYNSALMTEYGKYIGTTDSNYCGEITGAIRDGHTNLKSGNGKWTNRGVPSNRVVYWAESHDTYANDDQGGWTKNLSESIMDRSYAVSAARANVQTLYLSRPFAKNSDGICYGNKGSTHYAEKQVAAVNHFHNAMVGTQEHFSSAENCFVICRGGGAVIVNAGNGGKQVSVPNGNGLVPEGTYTDEVSGSTWTVTSSTISGSIGDTGIAVFYKGGNVGGSVSVSPNGGSFVDTTTVTLNASGATDTTYTTSEGDSGSYTSGKTITIGSKTAVGGTVTVTVNGKKESDGSALTATATFKKVNEDEKVTVNVDNSVGNWDNVYAYVYKGDGASATAMAAWPGTKMTKGSKYYTLDVTGFENGRVIFSDGTNSDDKRYPADQDPGLQIGGSSKLFTMPNKWVDLPTESQLSVSLSASPTSCKVGDTVTLTATATGATGSVTYAFKAGSQALTASGNTATWTASAAGTTTFTVTATDSSGSATATASVTVENGGDVSTPTVTCNKATGTSFETETLDITLSLSNAVSGTYSVDNGPVKSFTSSKTVTIGEGKIADTTVTVETTAKASDGTTKSYTFTFNKKYKKKTTSSSASLSSYYSTNGKGKGTKKTITVDGDMSDWNSSMIIAQGTANDDPRVYRPNSMYEVPLDMYTLYGAYDDSNLYLMWEMTNVQDIVAPGDDYPLTQGILYQTMNIPFFIAVSTGKSDTIGNHAATAAGATLWNSGITFSNTEGVNRLIAISTNGANGPYVYTGDSSGLNPVEVYGPVATATGTKKSGIQFNYGLGILSTEVWGLDGAYGKTSSTNPRTIGDMCNQSGMWVEFNAKGHNSSKLDFHYEMSIPLEELGVSASDIESSGVGVMVIMTSGKSGMDCLPYDLCMNDQADLDDSAGSQENNSFEKSDEDNVTSVFARIGAGDTPVPVPDPEDPLQVNFGADRSAPQLKTTALTLKGIGYGGTAPYKYEFYVDGTKVQASSSTDTYSWTPGTAKAHTIKCIITDSKGNTATSEKTFTAEDSGSTPDPDELSLTASLSATSITAGTSVTISASASGGTSPYQYAVYYKKSSASSFTTLQSYSTKTSATLPLSDAGTYTIRVKVKDNAGTVASKDLTLTVTSGGDETELSNTSKISATKIVQGSSVTVTCSATGGKSPYQYAVYYKKSSSSSYTTVQSYSSTSKVTITPSSTTVYDIRVKVKDNSGTVKTKDFSLTVTAKPAELSNTSKISATSVTLGTSVTVTGSATGGTSPYKYAFFLKKSTDSDYTTMQSYDTTNKLTIKPTKSGTYSIVVKVKDSKDTIARKEFTLTVKSAFTNTSTISATSITLGKSVTLTGKATGGTTPYQYAYFYKKASSSDYTTGKSYSTTTTYTFTPKTVTKYNLMVKVKDNKGTIAKKEFTVTVNAAALTNSSTVSATSITLGKSVTLTGKASGGTSPYQYAYFYKKAASSDYTTGKSYSTTTTYSFTPKTATKYNLMVKVKDNKGTVAKKEFTVTVNAAALTNNSTVSATSITLGKSVTLTGKASGGTSPYQYAYFYKKAASSDYTTGKSYSTTTTYSFTPKTATKYNFMVKVKDSKGTIAKKEFTVTVNAAALANNSTISATSISLGTAVKLTAKASGGTTPYQYAYFYKKAASTEYTTGKSYSTTTTYSFTPKTATKYNFMVKVKDNKGTVAKKEFTVTVNNAELKNTSTIALTSITAGKPVTVTCSATGGTTPYQYAVSIKKSTSSTWTSVQDYSTNTSVKVTPKVSGVTYDVRVKVKDKTGKIVATSFKLTAK